MGLVALGSCQFYISFFLISCLSLVFCIIFGSAQHPWVSFVCGAWACVIVVLLIVYWSRLFAVCATVGHILSCVKGVLLFRAQWFIRLDLVGSKLVLFACVVPVILCFGFLLAVKTRLLSFCCPGLLSGAIYSFGGGFFPTFPLTCYVLLCSDVFRFLGPFWLVQGFLLLRTGFA